MRVELERRIGKFSNSLDEYLYGLSLDGADDEAGSAAENGLWVGFLDLSDDPIILADGGDEFLIQYAIVTENDQGFVRTLTGTDVESGHRHFSEMTADM